VFYERYELQSPDLREEMQGQLRDLARPEEVEKSKQERECGVKIEQILQEVVRDEQRATRITEEAQVPAKV